MKIKSRHSQKPSLDIENINKINEECIHTYQQSIQNNKKLQEIMMRNMNKRKWESNKVDHKQKTFISEISKNIPEKHNPPVIQVLFQNSDDEECPQMLRLTPNEYPCQSSSSLVEMKPSKFLTPESPDSLRYPENLSNI